ncbi:MAG: hypothetical protein AAF231_07380 [Pseudomonadota bacterium]
MTDLSPQKDASVSRRYCVGIASVLCAAALMAGPAVAGGWETFVKRCVTPMEEGGVPSIVGLELLEGDPIGQAFDLPGTDEMAVRPAFGTLGTQCLVMTKGVAAAQGGFAAWVEIAQTDRSYVADKEIEGRWLSGDATAKPLAMDVWQEGDVMMLQLSFLETGS